MVSGMRSRLKVSSVRRTGNGDSSSSLSKNAASFDFVLSIVVGDEFPAVWKKRGRIVMDNLSAGIISSRFSKSATSSKPAGVHPPFTIP
jgi:hypothetical protein